MSDTHVKGRGRRRGKKLSTKRNFFFPSKIRFLVLVGNFGHYYPTPGVSICCAHFSNIGGGTRESCLFLGRFVCDPKNLHKKILTKSRCEIGCGNAVSVGPKLVGTPCWPHLGPCENAARKRRKPEALSVSVGPWWVRWSNAGCDHSINTRRNPVFPQKDCWKSWWIRCLCALKGENPKPSEYDDNPVDTVCASDCATAT